MLLPLVTALALAQLPDEGPTPAQLAVQNTSEREYVDQLLEDGRHVRFGTKNRGAVHVWRPRTYRRDTAQTIVYLHGFYVDTDKAMLEHQLATQFRDSGRNALFIVPQARSWKTDPVYWKDLEELLSTVERRTRLKRPDGPITVICHSGGYRTAVEWLNQDNIGRIILIDGLYGSDDEFYKWLEAAPRPRQLVLIGFDTQQHVEWFLRKRPLAVRLDDLPFLFDELPPAMRSAEVLYFQSERFDHMRMVTSGRLLPWLLHALR